MCKLFLWAISKFAVSQWIPNHLLIPRQVVAQYVTILAQKKPKVKWVLAKCYMDTQLQFQ